MVNQSFRPEISPESRSIYDHIRQDHFVNTLGNTLGITDISLVFILCDENKRSAANTVYSNI
jgi:hypothetical protein